MRTGVPAAVVQDFLAVRARNYAFNRRMVEGTAEGVFDYLIIPQDDTVDYGWNIAEARRLRRYVGELGAVNRVSIYPGTDETAMLLLARYAAPVSYTHLRAHETVLDLVCRLLLEKKNNIHSNIQLSISISIYYAI